jgi:dTMP kinase
MSVKPLFIVFEGIDGSGKTLQSKMLASRFERCGVPYLLTAEPSDGPLGREIRSLTSRLSPEEETHLFTADRRDHLERTILPALKQGQTVICDRYVYSSVAYQGARGVDVVSILEENGRFARQADLTFLLEISVDAALSRITSLRSTDLSPFEKQDDLAAVACVYRGLRDPSIRPIDAHMSAEEIHERIVQILREHQGCRAWLKHPELRESAD